jgi:hypothetical protein
MISRRFIGEHKYERLREAEGIADDLNTTLNRNNPKHKKKLIAFTMTVNLIIITFSEKSHPAPCKIKKTRLLYLNFKCLSENNFKLKYRTNNTAKAPEL